MKTRQEFKEEIVETVAEFLISRGCHDTGNVMMGSIIARKLVNELEIRFEVVIEEDEADGLRMTDQIVDAVLTKVLANQVSLTVHNFIFPVYFQPEDRLAVQMLNVIADLCDPKPESLHLNSVWEDLPGRCSIMDLIDALEKDYQITLDYQSFIGITTLREVYDAVLEQFNV